MQDTIDKNGKNDLPIWKNFENLKKKKKKEMTTIAAYEGK